MEVLLGLLVIVMCGIGLALVAIYETLENNTDDIANAAETLAEIATMQWHCSHGNCPYDVKENGGGHKCSQQAPDVVN